MYTEGDLQYGVQMLRVSSKLCESLHQEGGTKSCHARADGSLLQPRYSLAGRFRGRGKVMIPVRGNLMTTL